MVLAHFYNSLLLIIVNYSSLFLHKHTIYEGEKYATTKVTSKVLVLTPR